MMATWAMIAPVTARLLKSLTKACLNARGSESAARTDRSTLSIVRSVAENAVTTMSHLMMLCSFLIRSEEEWPVTLLYTGMSLRGSRRSHTRVRNTGMNERKKAMLRCSLRVIAAGKKGISDMAVEATPPDHPYRATRLYLLISSKVISSQACSINCLTV